MTKLDRMALHEAPRVSETGRPTIEVTLKSKGIARGTASNLRTVRVPMSNPMPNVITYKGKIFVRVKRDQYDEATIWPIVKDLDF
jgi:hypothetical protein